MAPLLLRAVRGYTGFAGLWLLQLFFCNLLLLVNAVVPLIGSSRCRCFNVFPKPRTVHPKPQTGVPLINSGQGCQAVCGGLHLEVSAIQHEASKLLGSGKFGLLWFAMQSLGFRSDCRFFGNWGSTVDDIIPALPTIGNIPQFPYILYSLGSLS